MICQNGFRFFISGVIAKKNFRNAKQKTFVLSSATKVVPLPLFGNTVCLKVLSGLFDCVSDALVRQLAWPDEWYLAAAVKVSRAVKLFLAGAPVKVSGGVTVDVYLQVWVVHL